MVLDFARDMIEEDKRSKLIQEIKQINSLIKCDDWLTMTLEAFMLGYKIGAYK